jgi:hypothetical protein
MVRFLVACLLGLFSLLPLSADACSHQVTVVYWTAGDCQWCKRWDTEAGLGPAFRRSPTFARLNFHTVFKPRLAQPFTATDYPAELAWLQQRVAAGEFKTPKVVPAWWVFVDRHLIDTYWGTQAWLSRGANDIELLVKEACAS